MTSRDGEPPDDPRPRAKQRKQVSADRLLRLLNKRLDGYGHCQACRFAGPIRPLEEPAEDGRNWSVFIPLVCSDGVGSGCKRIAERIIDDASTEFNLRATP